MPAALALVVGLATTGLLSAWVASVVPMESAVITLDPRLGLVMTEVKTSLYYAAHGLAIGSVIVAGILSALIGGFGILGLGARLGFCILLPTGAIWAAAAFDPREILSTAIFGATGPFVWFTLVFVMVGTDRRVWVVIDPLINVLTYASTGLALYALLSSEYHYYAGFSIYTLYAQLLVWLGGWTLLTATRLRGWRLLTRTIPLMVAALMAVCCQSRSWLLLCFLVGVTFVALRNRESGQSFTSGVRIVLVACVLCTAAIGLVYSMLPSTLTESVDGLLARLDMDTRTGQYHTFLAVVPITDLFLGRGPKGTWTWGKAGEYQFFDNGYLWMLFIGGLPTLLSYLAIVIWPGIRAVHHTPGGGDAAAVCLILCWGLALAGLSTFCLPSVGFNNFLISLLSGRCHLYVAERARAVSHRDRAITEHTGDFSRYERLSTT